MSKRFRIAKRISMEDIDHFEDIEVDDDFVDKDMAQIIADNEYDPLYDDCENIAVALQLAGYGKMSDLEAKLAESEKEKDYYQDLYFTSVKGQEKLKQQLAESEKKFVVANNLRKNSDEVLLNYKTKKYGLDKTIQELRKIKLSMPEKEWYYKGFENCERQMSSHIADLTLEVKQLKQQLAEKDQAIEGLQEINKSLGQTCNNDAKEIERLREELAEKEQIIKEMEQEIDGRDKRIDRLEEDYYQETRQLEWVNEQLNECEKQLAEKEEEIKELKHFKVTIGTMNGQVDISSTTYTDQDKISFAVEQLEQLRHDIWTNQADDGYTDMQVDLYDLNDVIDIRIMQIKEGK